MQLKRYSHSVRLQESEDGMMVYYADAVAAVEEAHQLHATERNELQALIDLQHKRTSEADAKWQAAHAKPDTLPDLGELIRWLEERAEKAETDCAEYLRERQKLLQQLECERVRSQKRGEENDRLAAETGSLVAMIEREEQRAQDAERERDDALGGLDKCKERLGDLQREQGNKGRSDNGLRARVTAAVAQLRSAKDGNQAKAIRSALATLAPASDHSTLDHE